MRVAKKMHSGKKKKKRKKGIQASWAGEELGDVIVETF